MRNSLTMPKEEVDALIAEGRQYVVRFKIEPDEDVHVNDLIRGEVVINSSILDDKVLYKSADELPTYHLANIVDDHLMEVSHVIRGEAVSYTHLYVKRNLLTAVKNLCFSRAERSKLCGLMAPLPVGFVVLQHV